MARISAAPLPPFSEARRNAIAIEPQPNRVKREKKTHHEVHEERKLTTKDEKVFNQKYPKTFVSFVIFVVRIYSSNTISMTNI
jgi:hypothetical protein